MVHSEGGAASRQSVTAAAAVQAGRERCVEGVPTRVVQGRVAEELAVAYLTQQGYRLIKTNHRCAAGEIDIIAWDGAVLCFVEVRSRRAVELGNPLESISRQKIRRIVRAAWDFLEEWQGPWPAMRFDALGIVTQREPVFTLLREAFEA